MIFQLTLVAIFILLPLFIVVDSLSRLNRLAWEWLAPAMFAISIGAAFLEAWLSFGNSSSYLAMYGRLFISIIMKPALAVFGAVGIFHLYKAAEHPSINDPPMWKILRGISSVALALLFAAGIRFDLSGFWYLGAVAVSFVFFAVSQVLISTRRELDVDTILRKSLEAANAENAVQRKSSVSDLSRIAPKSEEARAKLVELLRDDDLLVRHEILSYIGKFSEDALKTDPDAVTSVLREDLAGNDPPIFTLWAIAKHGVAPAAWSLVPDLILLLKNSLPGPVKSDVRAALVAIAGEDLGNKAEDWQKWWKESSSSRSC